MAADNRPGFFDRAYARLMPVRAQQSAKAMMQLAAANGLRDTLQQIDANSAASASMGGYESTRDESGWHRNWSYGVRDAAGDTLPQVRHQRGQCRDLVRNNGIAASAIESNVLRAVGTGLALSAQPNRFVLGWSEEQTLEWRLKTQSEWRMFADTVECDYYRTSCFDDICELVARTMLESGDGFTVLPDGKPTRTQPYKLRFQTIEADRVGNPNNEADTATMVGGIRFVDGVREAAYVYDQHPGTMRLAANGSLYKGQWIEMVGRSGRRRILQHFKMLRPEQPRGVPYLAPVVSLFKTLAIYTEAEVKAAIVSAFHTVFIESEAGTGPAPVYGLGNPADGGGAGGGANQDEIALGYGSIIGLAKGEKANIPPPGRPNPQFGAFVEAVLDQLGAGTFIGSEMLMKKYSTSYVAARAAFLDAYKRILDVRTRTVRTLCQPGYETWLPEAVILGRVAAPGFFEDPLLRWAYTRAAWNGDSQGSINPKDEGAAYAAAVEARLMTRERAQWELFGTDWQETYDTMKAEHNRLKADDMLPVPKAGAPKPKEPPAEPETAA
jgi:lambda family phage portal protein